MFSSVRSAYVYAGAGHQFLTMQYRTVVVEVKCNERVGKTSMTYVSAFEILHIHM